MREVEVQFVGHRSSSNPVHCASARGKHPLGEIHSHHDGFQHNMTHWTVKVLQTAKIEHGSVQLKTGHSDRNRMWNLMK